MKDNSIYEIYYCRYPYPFRFGSYHAILRSLTVAKLVERLYSSSRLSNETYQRLLRTRQLIRVLIYHGIDSEQAARAVDSINQAHAGVEADNEDYLYVLSTFFLEPLRWNQNYGIKAIAPGDIRLIVDFWRAIGLRMGIDDIPVELKVWFEFQQSYEQRFMAYSVAGHELAMRSIDELCRQAIPRGLRSFARQLLLGTLDDKVRVCLKIPKPIVPAGVLMKLVGKWQPSFEPKRDIVANAGQ